jgi:dynein heavy chain
VVEFGTNGKDLINEETIEFLSCYIELEGFTSSVAKNASKAAEGLCTWVRAMKFYHEASKSKCFVMVFCYMHTQFY